MRTRLDSRTCARSGCGVVFKPWGRTHVYCSRACGHEAMRVPPEKRAKMPCPVCGTEFIIAPRRGVSPRKCCGVECGKVLRLRTIEANGSRNGPRPTKFYEHDGKRLTVRQWAELAGLPLMRVYFRLRAGWTVAEAIAPGDRRKRP